MLRTSPFTKPSSTFAKRKSIYEEGDLKAQNGSPLQLATVFSLFRYAVLQFVQELRLYLLQFPRLLSCV
jgi:hypothetical protein